MSNHRCTGALPAAGLSRRAVLNRFGLGLGGIALADLVNPLRTSAAGVLGPRDPGGPLRELPLPSTGLDANQSTPGVLGTDLHFPAEGQARHLPVHGGRAVAARDLRLQAGAAHAQRRAAARLRAPGAAADRHVGQPGVAAAGRVAVQVRPARPGTARGSASCCRTRPKVVDDLCIVRSMYTEAINHDPAITFFQTGSQIAGRPSIGAWVHYGLGSDNAEPAGVRRAHHAGQGRPAALLAAVGQRLPAVAAPGRAVPQRQGRRCCTSPIPPA